MNKITSRISKIIIYSVSAILLVMIILSIVNSAQIINKARAECTKTLPVGTNGPPRSIYNCPGFKLKSIKE